MAEKQAEHRQFLEKEDYRIGEFAIRKEFQQRKWGQIFAFFIVLFVVTCGVIIALYSESTAAHIMGPLLSSTGLASIIYIFIHQDKQKQEDEN